MLKARRIAAFAAGLLLLAVGLVACSNASATPASCAFLVGDGRNNNDAKLHEVIYPGQSFTVGTGEEVSYVPCNSRNYITNDGTQVNANGNLIGDRHVLTEAYTSSGVPILIGTRVDWTLNQSRDAMAHFYEVCLKYRCASKEDIAGDANYSTEGWNGMLGENFGSTVDAAALKAAFTIDDSIWQKHDPNQYEALGEAMSAMFADIVRAKTGFTQDLFCGSGNSGWEDPNKPGGGDFTCTPVRVTIEKVERGKISADEGTAGVQAINQQRLENAIALYGDDAAFWLALQDTIAQCKAAGTTTCIFNIGGVSAPSLPLPTPSPSG